MSKVSVVIPVYKVEKYIERCVRSLFGQSLGSIEYVFVDDCSPDNSISIIKRILEEYPDRKEQVKIIHHETNQGVGAARKHGVFACTGDYIIHCDSDDWVDSNLYEAMYTKAVETNADIVCCPVEFCGFTQRCFVAQHLICPSPERYLISVLRGSSHPGLYCKLVRKAIAHTAITGMPEHIALYEDLLYSVLMIYACNKVAYVQDFHYHYERNADSITNRMWPPRYFMMMEEIVEILDNSLLPEERFSKGIAGFKMEILTNLLFRSEKCSSTEYYRYCQKYQLIKNIRHANKSLLVKCLLVISALSYPAAICLRDLYRRLVH